MTKFRNMALAGLLAAVPVATGAHAQGSPAEFQAVVEQVFTQADANGDGVLDQAEFANFHDLMRAQMEAKHFAKIDADGSGGISLAELEAAGPPHGGHGGPPD